MTLAGLRPVMINQGTVEDGVTYARQLRVYPLAQADAPPANRYIDAFPKVWRTYPDYDARFFDDLAQVIQEEPILPGDAAMVGMLARLGIEKGKPYAPDAATRKTLDSAARLGYQMLQHDFVDGRAAKPFWRDSHWLLWNLSEEQMATGFPFMENGRLLFDERADYFHWVIFTVKNFAKERRPTFYLIDQRDSRGRLLDGASQYRLRVPADVPAAQFWSAIVYSMKTKGFIDNADKLGLSSYDKKSLQVNADGSTDIYFGGKQPQGRETNWLPTGEPFFVMFRFYGPQAKLFDDSWRLPEIERLP